MVGQTLSYIYSLTGQGHQCVYQSVYRPLASQLFIWDHPASIAGISKHRRRTTTYFNHIVWWISSFLIFNYLNRYNAFIRISRQKCFTLSRYLYHASLSLSNKPFSISSSGQQRMAVSFEILRQYSTQYTSRIRRHNKEAYCEDLVFIMCFTIYPVAHRWYKAD